MSEDQHNHQVLKDLGTESRPLRQLIPDVYRGFADMSKAALALKWAVDEMERRYQLFADAGSKNIITFNRKVERVRSGDLEMAKFMPRRAGKVTAQGIDGEEVLLDPDDEAPDACDVLPEKLPYIVVVVDEFAGLTLG